MASAYGKNIHMIETLDRPQAATVLRAKPKAAILIADGVNCHLETQHAFTIAGAEAQLVHINELKQGEENLRNYNILSLSGGFSYGDDLASGKILATELNAYLPDTLTDFVHQQKGLVLGICNGYQVLVRSGLLPFGTIGDMQSSLTFNQSGHFQHEWIHLSVEKPSACEYLSDLDGPINLPIAHGEGQFIAEPDVLERMQQNNQIVFRYCTPSGIQAVGDYSSFNPNGSFGAIAGICDPTGQILGLMPHPERFVRSMQHPNARRDPNMVPQGLQLFQKMVEFVR